MAGLSQKSIIRINQRRAEAGLEPIQQSKEVVLKHKSGKFKESIPPVYIQVKQLFAERLPYATY